MKCFREYADEAAKFATPYVRRTGEFFVNVGDEAKDWYYTKKKDYKRRRKTSRLKACIQDSIGMILLIAGIIGGIAAAFITARAIIKKIYCSNHKIVAVDEAALKNESGVIDEDNQEQQEQTEKKKPKCKAKNKEKVQKNTGYITL